MSLDEELSHKEGDHSSHDLAIKAQKEKLDTGNDLLSSSDTNSPFSERFRTFIVHELKYILEYDLCTILSKFSGHRNIALIGLPSNIAGILSDNYSTYRRKLITSNSVVGQSINFSFSDLTVNRIKKLFFPTYTESECDSILQDLEKNYLENYSLMIPIYCLQIQNRLPFSKKDKYLPLPIGIGLVWKPTGANSSAVDSETQDIIESRNKSLKEMPI